MELLIALALGATLAVPGRSNATPSIAADGEFVVVAWRASLPSGATDNGNIRDIAFSMSRDAGRTVATPIRVSEDKWELEGCPDDGPATAVDKQNRVHLVWPTVVASGDRPEKALFYAMSADGRAFTARERIPTEGTANHPQIAIAANGSMTIAWDEVVKGKRRAAMARATRDAAGAVRFERRVVSGDDTALYPVLATTPDATIAAWTAGGGTSSVIRLTRWP